MKLKEANKNFLFFWTIHDWSKAVYVVYFLYAEFQGFENFSVYFVLIEVILIIAINLKLLGVSVFYTQFSLASFI